MTVAIWGSYNHGNFGDDLMAVMFARYLSSNGYGVTLITKNTELGEAAGVETLPTLADWNGAQILIGGGAMLSSESLVRRYGSAASRAVQQEFVSLKRHVRRTGAAVAPVSIGGDGPGAPQMWGARRAFFKQRVAPVGTVRLSSDVELMRTHFGSAYEFFPDVLFSTADYFQGRPNRDPGRFRVGVNLNIKHASPVVHELQSHLGEMVDVIPLVTHSAFFASVYEWGHDLPNCVRYADLAEFIGELHSLDVVISDKLHVGIVAATGGVPFLSYGGRGKTRSQHYELDRASALVEDPLSTAEAVRSLLHGNTVPTIADRMGELGLRAASRGHFNWLASWLERT